MRDDVGLELRREFEEAVETVEAKDVQVRPHFPTDVMEKFHATEADLQNMATRYAGLKIAGMSDRAGYAVAHAARIELRDARILIDKTRKAETAEAQTYIKTCNAVAKYLTNIIAPVEDALDAEEAKYDAEVEAEKGRKQAEAAAKLQKRIEELQAFGQPFTLSELTVMTDTQYGFLRATAEDAFKAREALRIEAEKALAEKQAEEAAKAEADRKAKEDADAAERTRMEKIRIEQAAEDKRLEESRAALRKEQEEFRAQKAEMDRAEREKKIAEEAAAKAKADAERKAAEDKARGARSPGGRGPRQGHRSRQARRREDPRPRQDHSGTGNPQAGNRSRPGRPGRDRNVHREVRRLHRRQGQRPRTHHPQRRTLTWSISPSA